MTPTQILRQLSRLDKAITENRDKHDTGDGHSRWLAYHAASCALDAARAAVEAADQSPDK